MPFPVVERSRNERQPPVVSTPLNDQRFNSINTIPLPFVSAPLNDRGILGGHFGGKIVVSASLNNNFSHIFVVPSIENNMKGYMYILECSNRKYYVGSKNDLKARIRQHQDGEGANFT